MKRRLLFYRDFQRYSGGHGKVWDYFQYTGQHAGWTPLIHLTPGSRDEQNPWRPPSPTRDTSPVQLRWDPTAAEALLLGGMDWQAYPHDDPDRPVINLVQGVRHGDPRDPRHAFLERRAIRICVSPGVADAITRHRMPNGPVLVIEAALQLPQLPPAPARRSGVFIDAVKQPELGRALASLLMTAGREVQLSDQRLPRQAYLQHLQQAELAVLLPRPTEGFYLPGLEAMALGCPAVVPDSVGNRAYLDPGDNALVPAMAVEPLAQAVATLEDPALRGRLVAAGRRTAARFGVEREREAFHRVLDDIDALWRVSG